MWTTGGLNTTPRRVREDRNTRSLSLREEEIANLAMEGLTDKEVAARLGIAPSTIKSYWVRIRQKTRSLTRAQAIVTVNDNPGTTASALNNACWLSFLKHTQCSVLVCSADSQVLYSHLNLPILNDALPGRPLRALMRTPRAWDEAVFRVQMNCVPSRIECELCFRNETFQLKGELMPIESDRSGQFLFLVETIQEVPSAEER
jgi:DNA-binding CsgD family transcriptional regulator